MAKQKDIVVKSNRLIEASYRLSLVEQQIVLYSICRAREEQKGLGKDPSGFFPNVPLTIRASDFSAMFSTGTGTVYDQLKDALTTLFSRSVTIHDVHPETGKQRVTETRWISDKSYIDGAGLIQFTFAPLVIPYITRIGEDGEFTQYRLEKIGKMSSVYAVRLYEILIQYMTAGKRSLGVDWLKGILCLTGSYSILADFKKRVLDVAVAQINEFSDIDVSYKQRKKGRVVTYFDFEIKLKAEDKLKKKLVKSVPAGGSDSRAKPGETAYAFKKRLAEECG
jgi:plasmid replication initiation protein